MPQQAYVCVHWHFPPVPSLDLVHRDLKPDNLLLSKESDDARVPQLHTYDLPHLLPEDMRLPISLPRHHLTFSLSRIHRISIHPRTLG